MLRLACALAPVLLFAAPASAELRAVAPDAVGVLHGDRVLWLAGAEVSAAPLAGGPAVPFGRVPLGRGDAGTLAAGSGVAVRDDRGRLFLAGADGGFRQIAGAVADPPVEPWIPALRVTDAGVFAIGAAAYLYDGGRRSEVALPPGADPERAAAAGTLGVAPTPDGGLVIFDLRTGTERHQISLGRYDAAGITGLAISPAGDVAATVPVGNGSDTLLWAPASARRVRVLATGRGFTSVAIAGGRVAYVSGEGLREGARVRVIDAATRRTVFRGPPAADITGLDFDGANVAFATPGCALAGTGSRRTLPPGPCVRTEVTVAAELRGDRVRVACINAPGRSCRVRVTLRRHGRAAGRADQRIRVGAARVLEIPVRGNGRVRMTVRVTDPDGRSRTVYAD